MERAEEQRRKLTRVKAIHTAVWLFFVLCIVLIPVASALRRFFWANVLAGFVCVEGVVLGLNRGRCPLTDVAARYTDERSPNFDIYLPAWLARNNKLIFGSFFMVDVVFLVWQFAG